MALRDYLKSQKSLRNNLSDCNVASVETPCDRTIDSLDQQYSGFASDVASVTSVTVDREHNSNTNQEHLSQMEKSSSFDYDNIYIKPYNKIKRENDSETGTPNSATVATVAIPQDSSGITGNSSRDTSATVATVEPTSFPNDKSESPIQCLERQIESIWRTRTPWSFDVPEGYEAKTFCRCIEQKFDTWWEETPGTHLMGVMVLPTIPDQPERICIYNLSHAEFDSPSGIDDLSITLQKMVLWAENCQTGDEWSIPAKWFEKAEGFERMADNVARASGRDRRIGLVEHSLCCYPYGYEKPK